MTDTIQERPTTFEHVNLKDVQPAAGFGDRPPIQDGDYNLEVVKAEMQSYVSGPASKKPGTPGEFINFQFAIVGDPTNNGRRIFQPGMFPGEKTDQQLRKLMDASGIPQTTTVVAWLADLVAQKARINAPVETFTDVDKRTDPPTTREKQRANLWKASPSNS